MLLLLGPIVGTDLDLFMELDSLRVKPDMNPIDKGEK